MESTVGLNREPVLVIAEAGVNHNGNLDMAFRLCDAAREAGADIVKFQTWKTDALMLREAELAEYQKQNAGFYPSQYEMSKQLEISYEDFRKIRDYCQHTGIRFLSTPDEEESLNFLADDLQMELIKIGSGEITNLLYLSQVGRKGKDVILSTGMADLTEVGTAFRILKDSGARSVILLHCTSNYPTPFWEVNLRAMMTLKDHFGVPVGYSDHTMGIEAAVAAVALGAVVVEKHLTLDRTLPGPDHKASLEPGEFGNMVRAIRNIEKALGDGVKQPQDSERRIRPVVQKSLVAKTTITKGEPFSEENVTAKRAGRGIPASRWPEITGRTAGRSYQPDDLLE
ncbi:MAG TPA: N-acetylneuraminate synthase [Bacteroidales bacterium]|nr:N-acetylneuraminate synthase [Bacteroidales bacterium]HRZ49914.1 N-acetylneuraminate synthase [Bacteroidales bacterium]